MEEGRCHSKINTNCPVCNYPGIIEEIWQREIDFFGSGLGYYLYNFRCKECGYSAINCSLEDLLTESEIIRNQEETNPAWKLVSAHLEKKLGRKPSIRDVQQFLQKP